MSMGFTKKMPSFGSNTSTTAKNDDTKQKINQNISTPDNIDDIQRQNVDTPDNINVQVDNAKTDNDVKPEEINELQDTIATLKQHIQELTEKNKTLETKLIYLASEYDNTKKRSAKELEDAHKFSIAKFANDAVKIFAFYDGVKMTIGEFNSLFTKLNIEKIDPKEGEMFDHNLHEAISRVPSELDVGAIVKVIRCGYSLHGRLLRPAMVVVSAGK